MSGIAVVEIGGTGPLDERLTDLSADHILLVDRSDRVRPDAGPMLAEAADRVDAGWALGDRLVLGRSSDDAELRLTPPWSPARARTRPDPGRPLLIRRRVLDRLAPPTVDADPVADLALRLGEIGPPAQVHRVLAEYIGDDDSSAEGLRAAVDAHCGRVGIPAVAAPTAHHGIVTLVPRLTEQPLVSIVIPTAGSTRLLPETGHIVLVHNAVRSIVERSTYDAYELVVVIDEQTPDDVVAELRSIGGDRLRTVAGRGPFDFSARINAGALAAGGEHFVLLNDDIEVRTPDWLEHLVMQAADATVGAVGCRLLHGDDRIQHAGVTLAATGPAHAHAGLRADHPGDDGELLVDTDVAAVTAACMLTPRAAFWQAGGLSPLLPVNYNDTDYCLKLARIGLRTVVTPAAVLLHHESASRGVRPAAPWEVVRFRNRWDEVWGNDPWRHPHLVRTVDVVVPDRRGYGSAVSA